TLYYIDFSADKLRLGGSALAQILGKIDSDVPSVNDPETFAKAFDTVQRLVKLRKLLALHDVSAGGLITTLLEMTFGNVRGGLKVYTDGFKMYEEDDLVKILFAENPAVVIQVEDSKKESVEKILDESAIKYFPIACPAEERVIMVTHNETEHLFGIDWLRDVWFKPSYLLDSLQSAANCPAERFENYKRQPLKFLLPSKFNGSLASRGLTMNREGQRSGVKAAIIREKGVNGDREMAWSLYLAGFDVKDVHMTDLMSGRETLEDVNMIVFCGGFSNSDVLGSAKGWAGGFKWNETARKALERYYSRPDTLSLGVCNGCQLMVELNLLGLNDAIRPKMLHNVSHKFESEFVTVTVPKNDTVMFGSLSGVRTGIWVAHGEGRFSFPGKTSDLNVIAKYSYSSYPGNPNGSKGSVAGIASADGRHVAMMPHLERAIYPWQCAYYPRAHLYDEVTVWIDAFINARRWVEQNTQNTK
ncbi:MAG: phosphoribosylformylglycinamidine synthase subunit PurQ, partial [Muribaculaceae bacterium]|nr:phosphoribosylformylglycinamidine synthase subunit PurQ [Muribaculaceae bacterium]